MSMSKNTYSHPSEIFVNFTKSGPRFYYNSIRQFRMFPLSKAAALEAIDNGATVYEKTTGQHWLAGDLKILIEGK